MKELFEELILASQKHQATDIHFTISKDVELCEMRGMKGFVTFQCNKIKELYQYLKYSANLNLTVNSLPQSGTFSLLIQEKVYYFRFSSLSTFQTQTGVLRILNNHAPILLENCSKKKKQNQQFKRWCSMRSGLIVMSGPTTSGKSTTVHAMLENIASKKKLKIITLEDPIEIVSKNYLQLQINEKVGFTYEEGIKQLMRHDPDVIMIGEIRDSKCAKMVYRAALSGHLVFTTLHAKSACEAIKRLNELGLDNSMLSETLSGIVNQRLYSNKNRKERLCIYEILQGKHLKEYLETRKLNCKHQNIFDEIEEAVQYQYITAHDAKVDLLDR